MEGHDNKINEQPPPYNLHGQQQQQGGPAAYPAAGWNPHQQMPPPPAQGYPQQVPQGHTVIVQPMNTPGVVVVQAGGCPNCRAGVMEDSFGCCAIFLAIFFFPIGILCCLAMREKRCTNCGASF